jgi:molybdopterin/thiamine biosynthesis adenylyltransferase
VTTWYDRLPDRLAYELEDLERRGLDLSLDEGERRVSRRIVLRGTIEHAGRAVALDVIYPDTFPYLRPDVLAPDLELERHINPFEGNLCLLDRSTRAWDPDWTAARLIAERVPYLLGLVAEGGEAMRKAESPQGEPISFYYSSLPGTVVFVPEAALHMDADERSGRAILASEEARPGVTVRALLSEVTMRGRKKKVRHLADADAMLRRRFDGQRIEINWARLDAPPASRDPDAFFAAAAKVNPELAGPHWQTVTDGEIAIQGVVFPEEVTQGKYEDTWLFAVRASGRGPDAGKEGSYLTRGQRLSGPQLRARIPALQGLGDATVAIVGLGGVGAPLALELARAQVGALRLLDGDTVETGNIVRWPLGIPAVGLAKTEALGPHLQHNYPLTDVSWYSMALGNTGGPRDAAAPTELELLEELLDGADLLIDATAEIGVGQLLADLAAERAVPLLIPWGTEGLHGGAVAVVDPPRTGCWMCLQHHLDSGSIPIPAHDDAATFQPRGCATPTFTGAAFDLLVIVAQAARTAAALLTGRKHADVAVVQLAAADGQLMAPHWTTHLLAEHPSCPVCLHVAA